MRTEDITIVGAGPAGLTLALQLRRFGMDPLLLDPKPGGLLPHAHWIENYPGFPSGISGSMLGRRMIHHAARFDIQCQPWQVVNAEWCKTHFHLQTSHGGVDTHTLVVATGTTPIPHSIKMDAAVNRWVHRDVLPLRRLRHHHVAIVGGGDAAFDYALSLAKNNSVTIFIRGARSMALSSLVSTVASLPAISTIYDTHIERVDLGAHNKTLVLHGFHGVKGSPSQWMADRLIIAIGRRPALSFLPEPETKTLATWQQTKRFFLVGDVVNGHHRQTAIAVGDAMRLAMTLQDLKQKA